MENVGEAAKNVPREMAKEFMKNGSLLIASADDIRGLPKIGQIIKPGATCGLGGGAIVDDIYVLVGLDGDKAFVFLAHPQCIKDTFGKMMQDCDEMIAALAAKGEVASNG